MLLIISLETVRIWRYCFRGWYLIYLLSSYIMQIKRLKFEMNMSKLSILINHFSERMYDAYHDSRTSTIPRYIVNEQLMLIVVIVVVTYFSTAFIGNNKNQLPFSCSEIRNVCLQKTAFQWKTILCVSVLLLRSHMRFNFEQSQFKV